MNKHTKAQIAAMAVLFYENTMKLGKNGDYASGWPGQPSLKSAMAKWLAENGFAEYRKQSIKSTKLLNATYPYLGQSTGTEDYKASPAEITKACNNTYGLGINPEATPILLTSLKDCIILIEQRKNLSDAHHKRVLRDAHTAIQKAKL